jgi:hypothetical protein
MYFHGWLVRITTAVRGGDSLVWEFKMATPCKETAIQWARGYKHTLPSATVEAVERF